MMGLRAQDQWLRSVLDWQSQEQAGGSDIATAKRSFSLRSCGRGHQRRRFPPVTSPKSPHRHRPPLPGRKAVLVSLTRSCRAATGLKRLAQPHLNFVKTSRARTKIRQWFKQQNRDENIAAVRELLERELHRLGVENLTYLEVASLFGHSDQEDFLADLGTGDVTSADVAKRVLQLNKPEEVLREAREEGLPQADQPQRAPEAKVDGIAVQGTGNLLTVMSRCCNPMPPDEIVGFVTRGRGVSVHRRDCPNVLRLDRERMIRVDWGETPSAIAGEDPGDGVRPGRAAEGYRRSARP
jgi:hypothetical protein